jgi:hypothetical protein
MSFDFKTATPAAATTAGYLFGAASQGAVTPTIYTTTFTGTGAFAMATSPTLVTPNIGIATGTSLAVTGVLTTGANSGTLGSVKLFGSTSGDVTVKAAAAAGTATVFQLPADNGTNNYVLTTNGSGVTSWAAAVGGSLTIGSTSIASGATTRILYDNAGTLGEYTISGSGTVVAMATSPSFTTPTLGVAAGTSLALGGATIGSDALGVTGTSTFTGAVAITTGSLTVGGNITAAAWTTNGIKFKGSPGTLTDTTSSGTVATAYTNVYGGNTIAASSSATFTNYYTTYLSDPVAGSNVTLTNKWSLGTQGSINIGQNVKAIGQIYTPTQTLTDQATVTWDANASAVAVLTLGGNRTIAAPTNLVDGGTYILRLYQDGTGSRTVTWNSVFKWPGGVAPTLSTAASSKDIVFFTSDGTNLYGNLQNAYS